MRLLAENSSYELVRQAFILTIGTRATFGPGYDCSILYSDIPWIRGGRDHLVSDPDSSPTALRHVFVSKRLPFGLAGRELPAINTFAPGREGTRSVGPRTRPPVLRETSCCFRPRGRTGLEGGVRPASRPPQPPMRGGHRPALPTAYPPRRQASCRSPQRPQNIEDAYAGGLGLILLLVRESDAPIRQIVASAAAQPPASSVPPQRRGREPSFHLRFSKVALDLPNPFFVVAL